MTEQSQKLTGQLFTEFIRNKDQQILVNPHGSFWYLKIRIDKAYAVFSAIGTDVKPLDIITDIRSKQGPELLGFVRRGRLYVISPSYAWSRDLNNGQALSAGADALPFTVISNDQLLSAVVRKYIWPEYKKLKAVVPDQKTMEILRNGDVVKFSSAQDPAQMISEEAEINDIIKRLDVNIGAALNGFCSASDTNEFIRMLGINMQSLAVLKGRWAYVREQVQNNPVRQKDDPRRRLLDALYAVQNRAKLVTVVLNVNGKTAAAKTEPGKLLREVRYMNGDINTYIFEKLPGGVSVASRLGINSWDDMHWTNIQEITYNKKTLYSK